jgi:hypothetical protein
MVIDGEVVTSSTDPAVVPSPPPAR